MQTSFLRASLNGALQAKQRLTHSDLAAIVVQQMGLSQSEYAEQPAEYGAGKKRNQRVFEQLLNIVFMKTCGEAGASFNPISNSVAC